MKRPSSMISGLCIAMISCASLAQQPRAQQISLDISARPIADALNEFAHQAGLQVVFYTSIGQGLRSRNLAGTYTADEALRRLLADTALQYKFINEHTVAIQQGSETDEKKTSSAQGTAQDSLRLAQAARSSADAGSATVADQSSESRSAPAVSEIIVTATRREERLIDVPMSIAVVTADDIDRRGLVGAADYLRGIPGVSQANDAYGQAIIIRGIETNPSLQNFSSGPTTATYFGETPTTSSAGSCCGSNIDIKLVDIERVEVLRGPQGTAFGSSSLGGAVRTVPVAPKLDRFEGKIGAGYSATGGTGGDNFMFQVVGNAPLINEKLAIRATAYKFVDSGFYRNRAGSDAAFQAVTAIPYGAQSFATDEEEVGRSDVRGARVSALFQAKDDLRFTLSYLTQKTEVDGGAAANGGGYEQTMLRIAPEHVRRGQTAGFADTDIDIANGVMEYDLSWAQLLATYSYVKGSAAVAFPLTYFYPTAGYSSLWPASYGTSSDHREHIGEIRMTTRLAGAWNFLAGLYAESVDDRSPRSYVWYGSPATNVFTPGNPVIADTLDRRDLSQRAAFGEASWRFLPGFTLTGGVRTYRYDRTVRVASRGIFSNDTTRNEGDASGTNFRANLSYKPGEHALLYAGWAQGFRLGKPQPGVSALICDRDNNGLIDGTNITIDSTRILESDEVGSYELGGKFALLDRRVSFDAAVFRMDWSNLPILFSAGCGTSYNVNAGAARSEGVELQANFRIADAFRVDLGGSWVNARLTEDAPLQGFHADDRLPGSPKVNANLGMQYEFNLNGHVASVRADAIYVGPFYGNVQESAATRSGDYVKVDAAARIALEDLYVDLYVHNVTDEDAFTFRYLVGDAFGFRLRPRTFGVQLGYSF